MTVDLFIDPEDTIDIDIYVASKKENSKVIFADLDKDVLIKDCGDDIDVSAIEKHTFTFQKPSYGDTNKIIDSSIEVKKNMSEDSDLGDEVKIHFSKLRYERFCALLKSWTLPAKVTRESIKNLHPSIAAIVGSKLEILLNDLKLS